MNFENVYVRIIGILLIFFPIISPYPKMVSFEEVLKGTISTTTTTVTTSTSTTTTITTSTSTTTTITTSTSTTTAITTSTASTSTTTTITTTTTDMFERSQIKFSGSFHSQTFLRAGVVFFISTTLTLSSFCLCFWVFCFYFLCKNKKQKSRSSTTKSSQKSPNPLPKPPIVKPTSISQSSAAISEQMVPKAPPRSPRTSRRPVKEIEMTTFVPKPEKQEPIGNSLLTEDESDDHIYENVNKAYHAKKKKKLVNMQGSSSLSALSRVSVSKSIFRDRTYEIGSKNSTNIIETKTDE